MTEATGQIFLGMPDGMAVSVALDISAVGLVVAARGKTFLTSGLAGSFAAIWVSGNGWRIVKNVLTDAGIDVNGWQLTEATALSANGTVVAGNGINPDGVPEAWIAVIPIPEPSTLWLCCCLLPSLATRQWGDEPSKYPLIYGAFGVQRRCALQIGSDDESCAVSGCSPLAGKPSTPRLVGS